jgi:hypothetical protein
MTDIIERLRTRKAFGSMDGGLHWFMLPSPDEDCQEAANGIEQLWSALRACRDQLVKVCGERDLMGDSDAEVITRADSVLNIHKRGDET